MKTSVWNIPNRLTALRVIAAPVVCLFAWLGGKWQIAALVLFLLASATDLADGRIARSRGLVTNLGKLLDPLADKLLVESLAITLCVMGKLPLWLTLVFVMRDLCVDGLRLIAAGQGKVIAAVALGKSKTVAQMALLVYALLPLSGAAYDLILIILAVISAVLTVLSGVLYFVNNREVLRG